MLVALLNKSLNKFLQLDPVSQVRLQKLAGKCINIELLPFKLKMHCYFNDAEAKCHTGFSETAEASVSGTPIQLARAMLHKKSRQHFFAEDLQMQGDALFAEEVMALFDQLDIDWEEKLSQIIGDASTHYVRSLADKLYDLGRQAEKSFTQNTSEYIQEEKNWLPSREELNDFFNDVDTLNMDTERLAAKVNLLKADV